MMTRKTKTAILIFVLIIAFIAIAIEAMYNKPHIDVAKTSPDISLESKTLLDDFENDENLANTKYLEQIIEVTGTISEVITSDGDRRIVISEEDSFSSIICHISPDENKKLNTLQKGQSITIKGICTGYLMDVILIKCTIKN